MSAYTTKLEQQNKIMLDMLTRIRSHPHYSMIDGMMNGWAKEAIKEYYRIERAYHTDALDQSHE